MYQFLTAKAATETDVQNDHAFHGDFVQLKSERHGHYYAKK